ncbi:MAG: glycosyltransferase [Phycisphaerales bacterium]|nr:glycosyltransferase [Phycisphaerales bacterium]
MRIALAHDWLVGMRGGEHVLDRIASLVAGSEPTPLYVMVSDGHAHIDTIDACRVVTSPLQRLPGGAGRLRRWYLPLYPWAVGHIRVESCDLLISTSSAAIKGITPPPGARHICYCHSPARYIWSRTSHYGGGLSGLGLRVVREHYRRWDQRTAATVDTFIANSSYTAEQIRRCFGCESVVIHPPVRTEYFTPDPDVTRGEALLVVSALEPYKRVDLAIEAANRLRVPLLIAGDGSQRDKLAALAGPTVTMLGRVSDDEVRSLLRTARAFVFPAMEDFGIAPVEAMACGCPVIALRGGGALDTVTNETGVFFDEQTTDALVDAIGRFGEHRFISAAIRIHAEQFSEAAFDRQMRHVIDTEIGRD